MFIPVNIRTYISLSLYLSIVLIYLHNVYAYTCVRARVRMCKYMCIYIYIYVCVCTLLHTYITRNMSMYIYIYYMRVNPFFLLLKHLQIEKKIGLVWHFRLSLVGHNWILNCGNWESIAEQDCETMGSTPY